MDEPSPAWTASLRRCMALTASAVVLSLAAAPDTLYAGVQQETPKASPQDPRATAGDKRPGETLSERLDRNSGVIHPPVGVDPGIAAPVPDPHPNSTPVIPPPGTPGGNPTILPK